MSITTYTKKEEIRFALDAGNTLYVGVWWFDKNQMGCDNNCCNEIFASVDEAVAAVMDMSDDLYDNVWSFNNDGYSFTERYNYSLTEGM